MYQATIVEASSVQGMCAKYLNGIETQLVGAFDDWAMHAEVCDSSWCLGCI